MIPVKSTIRTESIPYVNYTLLALNALFFSYTLFLDKEALEMFYQTYGIVPSEATSLGAYGFLKQTAKFFSSMFVHEGWLHIGGNLIFLYIFGKGVEGMTGHTRYLLLYLFCGLSALLVQSAVDSSSQIPVVGASGAISGVLGAYAIFFMKSDILVLLLIPIPLRFVKIKAYVFIIIWFLTQFSLYIGYIGEPSTDTIWAHMSGFACGLVSVASYMKTREYRNKKYRMDMSSR